MKELIEYMAKAMVENPDEVEVTEYEDGHRTIIHLDVAQGDMGKVIGRGGRVARPCAPFSKSRPRKVTSASSSTSATEYLWPGIQPDM